MTENQPLQLLIIEDDAQTRANLCDILDLDHYRTQTVATIAEAMDRVDWSAVFAIILGRKLSQGDWQDVLARLRAVAPDSAVLIVTDFADLEGAIAAMRHGADDYILKPVDPEVLRTSLARVLKRKEADQQRQLLAEAVRNLSEGVLISDGQLNRPGPRILFVNEAMSRITGYSQDEMIGRSPRMFQGKHSDPAVRARLRRELAAGRHFEGELINYRKDGSPYYVELFISPVKDRHGRITHFVSIHRDISAHKVAEERLMKAERLAAIGQTVAGLAHESRNAFQRSQSCLEMLALELEGQPDALELVERTQRALNHLHHLYEEVRDYAAPIKLDRQPCNIAHVWRDAWSHLEVSREEKRAELREDIGCVDLSCAVDWFAMGQVFRNILENAISACSDPGKIVIRCAEVTINEEQGIRVSIRDNGPGFEPQIREKVFDPFFTTKTKGTGLGMAIARRIVEAHGGRIAVGDTSGPGAEVVLSLPRF